MRKLAVCLALFLLVPACKKSVEGETKRWNSANRTIDELIVEYPGFKTALEQTRAKAKTAMDAAKQVEDEEKRIKQMSAANNLLTGGFPGQLKSADNRIKKLRDKLIDVAGSGTTDAERAKAKAASKEAQRLVGEAEQKLKRGAPSATVATTVLRTVTNDLRRAEQRLDKIAKANTKDQTAGKTGAGKTGTTEAAKGKPKPPEQKPWKCDHCDSNNKHNATSCSNCGAPKPAGAK